MKKFIYIWVFLCLTHLQAAEVGTGFSYQGELLDNGSPAHGEYDILFKAFDQIEGGTQGIFSPAFTNVQVSNGLFSIEEVSFDESQFVGDEVWLEIAVRKSSEGGDYSTLSPRQKIAVAPYAIQSKYAVDAYSAFNANSADYAENADSASHADSADIAVEAQSLAAGNANMADVLQFDGLDWVPVPMEQINPSPWEISGNDIYRQNGDVGVGVTSPDVKLHIHSNDNFELARFDGGSRSFTTFFEDGSSRGYIGSYQEGVPGTSDADFDLGTSSSNTNGSVHLTTKAIPRVSVDSDGLTGVNTTNPLARLHVEGEADEAPLRVRYGGDTKLWVKNTGETHVYERLISEGQTTLKGQALAEHHIKQDINSNGAVKFMVKFVCDGNDSSITSQVNNTNTLGTISIATDEGGFGCRLTFPTTVSDRYYIGAADTGFAAVNGTCGEISDTTLRCGLYNIITQQREHNNFDMTLLVF